MRMAMERVYISLPITGHPMEGVVERIERTKESLRKLGYAPISPLDPVVNNDHSKPYNVLLGNDITALLECDTVLFMDGWENSKGCRLEHAAARIYGKRIMFYEGEER